LWRVRRVRLKIRQNGTDLFETLHRAKNGTIWPVEVNVAYWPSAGGRILAFNRDITERKASEEEIRKLDTSLELMVARRTAELESMLANATIGLAFFDRQLRFLKVNHTLAEYAGVPIEDFLGRTIREPSPASADQVEPVPQKVFETGQSVLGLELAVRRLNPPHELRQVLESYFPVLDGEGKAICAGTAVVDITDRKRTEEELAKANAELARAARLKDEFLASMSHELRTPLNGILAMSEGLQEQVYGPLNAQQLRAVRDIKECGRHLLALINDILDVAKIEAGKIEVDQGPIVVDEFCQATIRLVRGSAQKKKLRLSLQLDESVGVLISDERRLMQILVNLLSNAVKFTPDGGEVTLEVAGDRARQQVCFVVRDNGIGISPEDLARLFQPFVQLDSRLSRNYPGTGLGLALVKRLTILLGGHTRVDSQPGVGRCFAVVLPWIEESRTTERESTPAVQPGVGPGRADQPAAEALVVVIDDNPFNVKGLCDYLRFKGFSVEWVSNALDGIGLTQRLQPGLVIMDIQMPGMDGLEAIRRIRLLPDIGDVPIIALTALAMPGDRERCLEAGATDYVAKPVNLKSIFQLASKLTAET